MSYIPISTLERDVVIVGAGHAGGMAAIALRQAGFAGSITLVGEEPHPPYERPPLSKAVLTKPLVPQRLALRKSDYWASNTIEWLGDRVVERIRTQQRVVDLCSGRSYRYQWLVLATGGRARVLPVRGSHLPGVFTLRTQTDAYALKAALPALPAPIVVVGGGYIGLEVAASLRMLGHDVHIIEAQAQLLARFANPLTARAFADLHIRQGVLLHFNRQVSEILGDTQVNAVRLDDGRELPARLVVVGIGLIPNQELAARAGLTCADGVVVDAYCRTSDPHILAIGDVASHPNLYAAGKNIRLESVQNAVDQARVAAQVILGTPKPYQDLPWFWSDQYDLKFQSAGLMLDYDDLVLRGDPANPSFSIIALKGERVVGVDAFNHIKDFMAAKQLIQSSARPARAQLADTTQPLKALTNS
jgi:3-phenylpropionate/trans-cinnamate dioxygenase ferredoxin reductase component